MKKNPSFEEAMHNALDIFLNELKPFDFKSSDPLPKKTLHLVYIPDQDLPIVGKSINEIMDKSGYDYTIIPENFHAFELSTDKRSINILTTRKREKSGIDSFTFQSYRDKALDYFINEILEPVEKYDSDILQEKLCFIVLVTGIEIPYIGETITEALELSGNSIDNLPETVFGFELTLIKDRVKINYALPNNLSCSKWATDGTTFVPNSMRGFAKRLRNQKGEDNVI